MQIPSPPLFWRTFLLIVLLIIGCLAATLFSFRVFEREPRARQIAQQVISTVNVTRSALLYSDPAIRRELLAELADNEGIRIVPVEADDMVRPFPDTPVVRLAIERIRDRLGPQTRLIEEVNGIRGIWVSFNIDEDAYWVFIDRDPLARQAGGAWVRWALLSTLLALLAAATISAAVNRPLARLTRAARELGAGRAPAPLPEQGPAEIRAVNQSFNRMVSDLTQIEQDRAVLLAGISHDLRTPLARLRLELEVNDLPEEARAAMAGDIEQMDTIVRQFLDYARERPQQPKDEADLSQLVSDAVARLRLPAATIETEVEEGLHGSVYRTELERAIDNLATNATRYGRSPDGQLRLSVQLRREGREVVLAVSDEGPGIDVKDHDRLLRPFERGDTARSQAKGAGLGLAIVERIARLHGGRFTLTARTDGRSGLRAALRLPT
ncbi:MAG: HAMP domain-containing protein [Burkholderiales bacterium]|jgi:two-component system osmolarity sensor histidine kinase EnvZ|nr:HAMP domain-containing protein [Burkholderiales bacterium]